MTTRIQDAGETCIILELDARVDPEINDRCIAIADHISRRAMTGVRDVVATYHTVAVHIDPLRADRDLVEQELKRAALSQSVARVSSGTLHEIPVCYGNEFGPDLEEVARITGYSADEVVKLHTEPTYRVYMMGFVPGFAYLGTVIQQICVARHETPRLRVPAGSVGLAGNQTGIYPLETPGGWQLIGRTWIRPFDQRRAEPLLFQTGDRVRFVAASRADYVRASKEPERVVC